MAGSRNKHAWIWVAIAAISLASVSRAAAAGPDSARAHANPVLHFLIKSHSAAAVAKSGPAVRLAQRGSLFRDAQSGTWITFLPVYFIGVVPLAMSCSRFVHEPDPLPAAPLYATFFQRPPPVSA
jgi:hypothetical protein